jgi:hypothetical protein
MVQVAGAWLRNAYIDAGCVTGAGMIDVVCDLPRVQRVFEMRLRKARRLGFSFCLSLIELHCLRTLFCFSGEMGEMHILIYHDNAIHANSTWFSAYETTLNEAQEDTGIAF